MEITNLKEYLQKNAVRSSHHRLKVLEYLMLHKTHPTVEMIHKALSQELPTLSKTTVYNTLKLFLSKEIVSELTIDENELRYDFNTTPHAHFKCLRCGQVLDVFLPSTLFDQETIEEHRVLEYHVYLKGVCRECLAATTNL